MHYEREPNTISEHRWKPAFNLVLIIILLVSDCRTCNLERFALHTNRLWVSYNYIRLWVSYNSPNVYKIIGKSHRI